MLMKLQRNESGFTLIELMIVVAIIGILAVIAVPQFLSYRNKTRVAAMVSTSQSIRVALSSFAADDPDNEFPLTADIADYADLVDLVGLNGVSLQPAVPLPKAFIWDSYTYVTGNSDYEMWFQITGPAAGDIGSWIRLTSAGIQRCKTKLVADCQ